MLLEYFNWFDVVALVMVIAGVWRGTKCGISQELLSVLQWLSVVVVCSLYYEPVGVMLQTFVGTDPVASAILAYGGIACALVTAFRLINRAAGGKLVESEWFGRTEPFFGFFAGGVTYACMILAFLAVLNAPNWHVQEARIGKTHRGEPVDVSKETAAELQYEIMRVSFVGKLAHDHLSTLMIKQAPMNVPLSKPREGLARRAEREVNGAMGVH